MTNQYDEFLAHMWEEIKREFSTQDIHMIQKIRDRTDLECFVADVCTQSRDYTCHPRSKASKIRVRLQHACARFSEFLECYTGIAELAKGIHPKGGSLGYGVVSVLLMIVRNKDDYENLISLYLEHATKYMHDLVGWQNIYPCPNHPALAVAILEIYKNIFRFCIDTWKYYAGCSVQRWWKGLRPAKYSVQPKLDKLNTSVKRLEAEVAKLLHAQVIETKIDLQAITRNHEKERRSEWQHVCKSTRYQLECSNKSGVNTRLQALEEEAQSLVIADSDTYDTMQAGNLSVLQLLREYKSWRDSIRGGILYVSALNHPDADSTNSLWLSLAIAEFASSVQREGCKVIFHVVRNARDTPHSMMSNVICEILEWDMDFFVEHRHLVQTGSTIGAWPKERVLQIATELLGRWSISHPDEQFYLVIDRVDRWLRKDSDLVKGQWIEAIETLFEWVSGSQVLKVCMLAEHSQWGRSVNDIMRLTSTRWQLREAFWNTGCLRQGHSFDLET